MTRGVGPSIADQLYNALIAGVQYLVDVAVLGALVAVAGGVLALLFAIYALSAVASSRGPMRTQPESDVGLQASVAPAAVCPGTFLDASPDRVLGFGGAVYSRKLKVASERLEFCEWGVRLRRVSIVPSWNMTRDVRYEDVSELGLLAPTEYDMTWRGVRLRTALAGDLIYFVVSERALPQLVAAISAHGIDVAGQVKPTRQPHATWYVYPAGPLEEIPKVLRDQLGDSLGAKGGS